MEVVQYKCPNCGANLEFQAATQDFGCKYCDSSFTSAQLAEIYPQKENHRLDVAEPPKSAEEIKQEEMFAEYNALYNCPSCGAAVVTDSNTSATKCVYCNSPVMLTGRLSGEYKPSKVIPFKITEREASEKLHEYCKKKWFLPSGFLKSVSLSEMKAIYVPYWIVDCAAGGMITANCKKVRTWTDGSYMYTETKEYVAVRDGDMTFENIPHDASTRADDVLMESIEPFNYGDVTDFKMSYLSGYIAEKYDVTKDQAAPRVKERAVTGAVDVMKATIVGYSTVTVSQNTVAVLRDKWRHYLLPVWFLTYKYNGVNYYFAVNGQTGKFAGNLPIVWGKVALAIAATMLGLNGLAALAIKFLGG